MYSYSNSYNEKTNAIGVSKHDGSIGYGFVIASGYSEDPYHFGEDILIIPQVSYQYGFARVSTSLPFGAMLGSYDVINFQLMFNIQP